MANDKTFNIIKRVVCVEGERFYNIDRDYYCDGIYLGTAKTRSLTGKPLEQFKYDGIIPHGYFVAFGSDKNSFDSRYFGLVKECEVKAIAKPIF
ncbi:MAG: hypothetical protein D6710_09360 [Nitrospirae bacterium]|nr:MAG: hypothetical protein D6710_09360 [Nitrospirota bacterium]